MTKADWWPQASCGDWWPFGKKPGEVRQGGGRPRLVVLVGCQQVRISGLTFRNAPSWTIHPIGCEDVVIESISNLLCRSENGVYIHGWATRPVEDIVFDNVRVEVGQFTEQPGGFYDARPDGLFQGIYASTLAGIHCEYARGLTLRNTRVVWGERLADCYGPALESRHVEDLRLEQFTGKAARPGQTPDQIVE